MKKGKSSKMGADPLIQPMNISIDQIEISDVGRLREADNEETIEVYADTFRLHMKGKILIDNPFAPCGGYFNENDKFVPTIGRHRILAAMKVGLKEIQCIVYPDKKSAIWEGIADNQKNGLHNSRADKKRMIEIAITTCGESNRTIAKHMDCSPSTVDQIKRQLRKNTQLPEKIIGQDRKKYSATKSPKIQKTQSKRPVPTAPNPWVLIQQVGNIAGAQTIAEIESEIDDWIVKLLLLANRDASAEKKADKKALGSIILRLRKAAFAASRKKLRRKK